MATGDLSLRLMVERSCFVVRRARRKLVIEATWLLGRGISSIFVNLSHGATDVKLGHLVAPVARAGLQRLCWRRDLVHLIKAWSFPQEALRGLVLGLGCIWHLCRLTEPTMDRFCGSGRETILSAKN